MANNTDTNTDTIADTVAQVWPGAYPSELADATAKVAHFIATAGYDSLEQAAEYCCQSPADFVSDALYILADD